MMNRCMLFKDFIVEKWIRLGKLQPPLGSFNLQCHKSSFFLFSYDYTFDEEVFIL